MDIPNEEEQSRFQRHHATVMHFLEGERNEPNKPTNKLYPHQIGALFAIKKHFDDPSLNQKVALVVAPTGAGKTGIVTLLPYVLATPKTLVLSPSVVITDQLEKAFGLRNNAVRESFVYERGIIKEADLDRFLEIGQRIKETEAIGNMQRFNLIIVNAQKFGSQSSMRLADPPDTDEDQQIRNNILEIKRHFSEFTTLIVDEAHHYPATTWDLIVEQFKEKQIIFLTATPFRGSDREPLWKGQQITYSISKSTLIRRHIIRPCEFKELIGENIGQQIMKILDEHDLQEPSIKHKAMVLVSTLHEAENGPKACENRVATYYASSQGNITTRNLKRFETDDICRILFVCGSLLEGYDNSNVSVCVILRNVGVLGLFTQFVGRCIRVSRLDGRNDTVTAVVASMPKYHQRPLFVDYQKD